MQKYFSERSAKFQQQKYKRLRTILDALHLPSPLFLCVEKSFPLNSSAQRCRQPASPQHNQESRSMQCRPPEDTYVPKQQLCYKSEAQITYHIYCFFSRLISANFTLHSLRFMPPNQIGPIHAAISIRPTSTANVQRSTAGIDPGGCGVASSTHYGPLTHLNKVVPPFTRLKGLLNFVQVVHMTTSPPASDVGAASGGDGIFIDRTSCVHIANLQSVQYRVEINTYRCFTKKRINKQVSCRENKIKLIKF